MNLSGSTKTALITGGGRRRLGNFIARVLGERGYRLAIHYHSSGDEAEATIGELRQAGVDAAAFQADVADEQQVERMFTDALGRFGRLDLLVATAAIWSAKPLEEVTADDVRKNFEINTLGTFLCARRAGLIMAGQPEGGAIVTIGDWAIERPYRDHAAYFISKGAIPTLTRTLAVELAHRNPKVRVNCILPGPVMLPEGTSDQEREEIRASTLVKQVDRPDAVADAVLLLAENDFLTGVCLPVDGGRIIHSAESESQ